jgi:hypothetical protein
MNVMKLAFIMARPVFKSTAKHSPKANQCFQDLETRPLALHRTPRNWVLTGRGVSRIL